MDEIWKDCADWEDLYQVSNLGNVRSKPRTFRRNLGGKHITTIQANNGYMCVNLTGNGKRKQELVHRLILKTFLGHPIDGHHACHNNGIRSDNRLKNLRWDTIKNNHADKLIHGTSQNGENNGFAKLNEEQARIVKYSKTPLKELAKKYNVSFGCVEKIRYRQSWKHI